jgi:protein-tyrosine phosphatase
VFIEAKPSRKAAGVSSEHVVVVEQSAKHSVLEGCCNFRDLGGYRTSNSAVRRRRLFRSDSLAGATPSDYRRLAELRLSAVIDLRSRSEVTLAGRFSDPAVGYHNLPLGDPLAEAATVGWSNPEHVATHYLELLLSSDESVREALAVLTDPAAYPAVIHCSVGKDRTGILVALLLSLVGVDDADVVADYALSGMGAARLVLRLRELCADNSGELDRFLPALLSAEPDTMRCFLAQVRGEFGSVEGYVVHLGLTSAIGYLRAALLERDSSRVA